MEVCSSLDRADRYADYGMGFSEAMKIVAMYLFEDDKSTTHGDRLRSMDNDFLAVWMERFAECPPPVRDCQCDDDSDCYACWLAWLQSPAGGGESKHEN